jgi:hypothetical protein
MIDPFWHPAGTDWKPIETAPKDGTHILLYPTRWTGISADVGVFDHDKYAKRPRPYWRRRGSNSVTDDRGLAPTHWQHLPPPPITEIDHAPH